MDRNFTREFTEEEINQISQKTKIGVFALGTGTGASFISTLLAEEFSLKKDGLVSYIEISQGLKGKALTYDSLNMKKRFGTRKYIPIYSHVENNRSIKNKMNLEAAINWGIITDEENSRLIKLTTSQENHLINNFPGDIIICDIGHDFIQSRFIEMDTIICVIDPLPSKLIGNKETLSKIKSMEKDGLKIIWIFNKMNAGVNIKLLKKYTKIKEYFILPYLPEEYIYKAEYNSRLPYEQKEIKKEIKKNVEKIVNHHFFFT